MTYVTEQTSAELRAHMRRLQKMPGWHNPLDDRLFSEIVAQDEEIQQLRALSAAPQSDGWRPIAESPEGVLVVVGWLDPEDSEHPERHDFDYLEDGVWQQHSNNVEHFDMCAPPGSRGPKNEAPYTHFMRIGPIPTTQTQGQSHGQ